MSHVEENTSVRLAQQPDESVQHLPSDSEIESHFVATNPDEIVLRFEVTNKYGDKLIVYGTDENDAMWKVEQTGVEAITASNAGYWDPSKCMIVDDPSPVYVEGDVWARPQKSKS